MTASPSGSRERRGYCRSMELFERLRQLDALFVPGSRTPDPRPDYSSYWRWYRGKRLLMSLTGSCLGLFIAGTTVAVAEWSTGRAYSGSIVLPAMGAALLSVGSWWAGCAIAVRGLPKRQPPSHPPAAAG